MDRAAITTELVRHLRNQPPARQHDFRDPTCPGLVLRARPSGVHSWRVRTPDHRWISLARVDELSVAKARKAAQDARAKARFGDALPILKKVESPTLGLFLDRIYQPWMAATNGGRVGQVRRIRAAFVTLLETPMRDITPGEIERWLSARSRAKRHENERKTDKRVLSAATVNRDLGALRAAFVRAVEWGQVKTNPLHRFRRGREDESAVIRFLSADEEKRLREALKTRDDARRAARESANEWRRKRGYSLYPSFGVYTDYLTPVVLLALNTGLRRGELLRLRWHDVNVGRNFLTVAGAEAKTGQTRHVPLNTEAVKILEDWRETDASTDSYVFAGIDPTTPITEIKKGWKSLLSAAAISNFRFHDLRHTFASKLVMAGVDLNTVRELLGHSSISMTLRYAHLAPEHKAAAVERLVSVTS